MINQSDIKRLILEMTDDLNSNMKKIQKVFGSLTYTDEENQSLLHIFVDNKYDEEKCFLAIYSLLKAGLSPNLEDDFNYNFIQTALYAGYSENFILKIILLSLEFNLDINHIDSDKDTIMHTAIYSDDYLGEVINIYHLLCEKGFDSTKIDHDGRNLLEAMIFQKQYSESQIEAFKAEFHKNTNGKFIKEKQESEVSTNNQTTLDTLKQSNQESSKPVFILPQKEISELEQFGKVLNKKKYLSSPTIGREKELKDLMLILAKDETNPMIVGESRVGKTALVDELVYRIINNQVPSFLQNKIILEIAPNELVAGCKYTGTFQEVIKEMIQVCEKYDNVILFIDEIHEVYGTGAHSKSDNDLAAMLKRYIDRTDIKIIGTTTDQEYDKYFSKDALKGRFDKLIIKEPTEEVLYQIIDKVMKDFCLKNAIQFENEEIKHKIIEIIISSTNKKSRVYTDIVNNPALSISIIDQAFACTKMDDSDFIGTEHFIESFELCDRIYDYSKEKAIQTLKSIKVDDTHPENKILTIDFNKKK